MSKLVRIRLQIRRKTSWLSSATIATVTFDCRPLSSFDNLQLKTVILDVYEPASVNWPGSGDVFLSGSPVDHLQPINCLAFLFLQPQITILNATIDQNGEEIGVKSLQLGISRQFGDIGFEYCGRDKKWLTTWSSLVDEKAKFTSSTLEQAGPVNVVQFGLRAFAPTLNIFFADKVENLPIIDFSANRLLLNRLFPIDHLSPEVICRIVRQIPTEFRVKAIFALSGTCRRLRSILSHPFYYKSIDLKLLDLNEPQLKFFRERALNSVENLRISHSSLFKTLNLMSFNRLTVLVANCCQLLDDKFLEEICSKNTDSLVELDVSYCKSITPIGFSYLSKLKRLRSLSVGSTRIDRDSLVAVMQSNSGQLESLGLSSLATLTPLDIDQLCSEFGNELRYLDLSCSDRLTLQGVRFLAASCKNLEQLNLRRTGNRNVFLSCDLTSCGLLLAASCPRLRVIGLPIFVSVQDIRALSLLAQSLEEVYIHEVVDSSYFEVREALNHLANTCPKLRYLTIRRHSTVDDAVDEEFCTRLLKMKNVTITPLQW